MNASRLREIADLLLKREEEFKIQQLLQDLNSHISTLAGAPQDAGNQTNFAGALEKLRSAMNGMMSSFPPAQVKLLQEIGADRFFTTNLPAEISTWVQENPITPAVTQQKIGTLTKNRNTYIEDITQLRDKLRKLNIEANSLGEGTAEVGFLIPRELFHNRFDELIKELGALNYILRTISEVTTGSVQPIDVRQISTSDPQFFFGLDPAIVAVLGAVVTWALMQWKQVEEIRKIRSETKKNSSFTEKEIKDFFDSKIDKTIKSAVDDKTNELLGTPPKGTGHAHQKRAELVWALESILARVERGMTVEIRFVPPPAKPDDPPDIQEKSKQFAVIAEAVPQLVFPTPDAAPVLELPPPEPDKGTQRAKDGKA